MDLEHANSIRMSLHHALVSLSSNLTPTELKTVESIMESVNNAIRFHNPLGAVMEMMLLVGTLFGAQDELVRNAAPEIAHRIRSMASAT